MTQLLAIDDDFHAALKLMSADPKERRGMKAIVQDTLQTDRSFTKVLSEARVRLGLPAKGGKK
jgi:molecular chaperone GrpE (heat shock protein)